MAVAIKGENIPPLLLEKLGLIVVRWGFVESLLSEFLSTLIKSDPGATYIITQNVASSSVSGWVRTLCGMKIEDEDDLGRVLDLLNEIDVVRADRNMLVHGVWAANDDEESALVQTVRLERREIVRENLITAPDLDEILDHLADVLAELIVIGTNLGFIRKGTS